MRTFSALRRIAARLRHETSGLALIEFAFAAPILIALYLGGYQLCDAIAAKRKVTTATRAVADLTSQYTSVTTDDLDAVLNASQQIMAPYKVSNASLIVTEVTTDAGGNSKVVWSRGKNATAFAANSTFTIPAAMKQNNTSVIIAAITYSYMPVAAGTLIGNIPMTDTLIMSPRASTDIPLRTS